MDFLLLSRAKSCPPPHTESGAMDNECIVRNIAASKTVCNEIVNYTTDILPKTYTQEYQTGDPLITKHSEIPFPYSNTKLRAEAPPFTPEGIIISVENTVSHVALDMASMNQQCFLDINIPQNTMDQTTVNENYDEIKEQEIQTIGPGSSQHIQEILPEVNTVIAKNVNEVAVEASPSIAVREEIEQPQYPRRPSILSRRFTFRSRTQIAVLTVSIVISAVLIVCIFI